MIAPPTPPSASPAFQWVLVGKRNRLTLVRRLSLSFELRRRAHERHAELWVYGDDRVRRWRVTTNAYGDLLGGGRLAPELAPLDLWIPSPDAPPRWDHGRCVVDASPFSRLRDTMATGELSLDLRGAKVVGSFRLSRTPLSLGGEPQWRIRRDDAALVPETRN